MKRVLTSLAVVAGLSGCAEIAEMTPKGRAPEVMSGTGQIRPVARPSTLNTDVTAVSATARTIEEFDTTTAKQRAAAASGGKAAEADLGVTVASLGAPSEPGFWLKTPLVAAPATGRVIYPATGKSVDVALIPIDGPKTAGSRMSLSAMRLIDAPLTGLPEVRVFRVGG